MLEWAARHDRIVLTHDVSTMRDFAYQRVAEGLPMPGVLAIPATVSRSEIIEELLLIAASSEPSDWKDSVHFLPLR